MIKKNIQQLQRPHWSGLLDRVEKIEEGYVNLDRNENHDDVLKDHIQTAIKNFIPLTSAMYYEDLLRYYDMFADHYKCSHDNILITAGCDEAIRLAFESTLESSSTFLTIAPTYRGSITNSIDLCDNIIECDQDEQSILDNLHEHSPDVFYICSPNNPTGKVFTKEFIEDLCINNPETMIFLDNTYKDFCDTDYFSLIEYKNCVIGFSYSKSWGLAGARLGLLFGHADTMSHITKIRPIMSVSAITLRIAEYLHTHYYIVEKSILRNMEGIYHAHKYFSHCKIYSEPTLNHIVFEPTDEIINNLDSCNILYGKANDFSETAIRLTTLPVEQFEKLLCSNTYK